MGILPKEGGEHQKELKQPSLKWINNHQSHQRNQSKFNTKHGGGNTMTTIISIPLKERCWSKQQRQNQGHPSTTHTKTNHTATWAFKATNHPPPPLKAVQRATATNNNDFQVWTLFFHSEWVVCCFSALMSSSCWLSMWIQGFGCMKSPPRDQRLNLNLVHQFLPRFWALVFQASSHCICCGALGRWLLGRVSSWGRWKVKPF